MEHFLSFWKGINQMSRINLLFNLKNNIFRLKISLNWIDCLKLEQLVIKLSYTKNVFYCVEVFSLFCYEFIVQKNASQIKIIEQQYFFRRWLQRWSLVYVVYLLLWLPLYVVISTLLITNIKRKQKLFWES